MQRFVPLSADLAALGPVLETALDAVVVIRSDGTVIGWNAAAQRTFGWSSDEVLNKVMADLIVPEQHREAHCAGLQRYLETGEERVLNRLIEISALTRDGLEIPVELSITRAPFGGDPMFIGFLRDISERRRSEARVKRQAREAELLFEVTRLAAETESFEDALRSCLKAICDLTRWPLGHALVIAKGRHELVSTAIWHEAHPGDAAAIADATREMRFAPGTGLPGGILETGEPVWMSDLDGDPKFARKGFGFGAALGFPIKSEGKIIAVLEFFTRSRVEPDPELMLTVRTLGEQVGRVFERRRTEEHQKLLLNELNHRVKNTLAIVQGVALQTFRGDAVMEAARQAFDSRLGALAAAHDVLTGRNWESASLREVVERAGSGCGAAAERVSVEGPEVQLEPSTAVSFAMALHELCTNAVKYGALSNDVGKVQVSWQVTGTEDAPRLSLKWQETGGPPVVVPENRGFGSRMIERALASELAGVARLDFRPEGLLCLVEAPLSNPAERDM